MTLAGASAQTVQRLDTYRTLIERLARLESVSVAAEPPKGAVRIVLDEGWQDADFLARFATPEGVAALRALTSTDTNAFAAAKTYWKSYSNGVTAGGFNSRRAHGPDKSADSKRRREQ